SDLYGRSLAPFTLITRRAVEPSAEERENNPRARSAKLRAARKNDQ
ncbi:MAG: 16S rRNA (cytosine(1402)-N(4))-methyltransferase, partial [Mucinivorans sp.]